MAIQTVNRKRCGCQALSQLLSMIPLLFLASPISTAFAQHPIVEIKADFSQVIHRMKGGIGASWHAIEEPLPVVGDRSHGGSGWGAYPPAEDETAWKQIYRHARWLGFDFCRVEIEQRVYEPERSRFTWDSPEMLILYRILDWCQKHQVDVFFQQMWGNVDWNAYPEWRGDRIWRLHSAPYSLDDFAVGLAELMSHLTKTKRYSCIRWLCINNEPGYDWSWWQKPPNVPLPITPGLEAVRKALDRKGLHLPLSAPDWTDLPELQPERIDFDSFIGAYDVHSYYARFDWADGSGYPLSVAEKRLKEWVAWAGARGKPLFLSELGTMIYGWGGKHPGPSTYEAALKDAELVVRGMAVGVDGFNRWSYLNRGDLDGQWQLLDTWNSEEQKLLKEYLPKANAYYVYGLLCRFTAKNSAIVQASLQGGVLNGQRRVFAAALLSPKNEVTLLVANDAPSDWQASITLEGVPKAKILYKYQMTPTQRDKAQLKIAPLDEFHLKSPDHALRDELPGSSLTVYSSFKLAPDGGGVIVE